jgi:hypothetical protein
MTEDFFIHDRRMSLVPLMRERCGCTRSAARLLVEPVKVISFLMSREMLHGIKPHGQRAVQPGDSSLTAGGA